MKSFLKWAVIVIGILVLLVIVASIVLMVLVNKELVAGRMESYLQRHVTIEDLKINPVSAFSGIRAENVRISNHKELMLENSILRIVRYENGTYNFSDLLAKKETAVASKEQETKQGPEPQASPPERATRSERDSPGKTAATGKPFKAADLPVSIQFEQVGIRNGTVTLEDRKLKESFEVYGLNLTLHSADIDPATLENRNRVMVDFESGVKPANRMHTGSVDSFDVVFKAAGNVKPFDPRTQLLDPEVALQLSSPKGEVTGVGVFQRMSAVKILQDYIGQLGVLQDKVTWTEAVMDAWYKTDTVKVSSGELRTQDFDLGFAGSHNIRSKEIDLDLALLLDQRYSRELRTTLEANLRKHLKGGVAGKALDEATKGLGDKLRKRLPF